MRRPTFTFVVAERVVVAPERVAEGMRIWADCLARRLASASAEPVPDAGDGAPVGPDGTERGRV